VAGSGFNNGVVNTVISATTNTIAVGGAFTTYNSITTNRFTELYSQSASTVTANRIVRLNSNGTIDNTFNIGSGFNNNVNSISVQPDGKILVGGNFGTYNDVTVNRFARLITDGTLDTTFNDGSGFNSTVNTVKLGQNNNIFVGGFFTNLNGVTNNYFTVLLSDGIEGESTAIELFTDCETCEGYFPPISANTEYIDCLFCEGDALLVDAPHPVWTGLYGGAVTQLDAVLIGGNGWNS
jgi:hypothetical protein